MGRFATSWQLTKESWAVVKEDKELMWMPVLSFLASMLSVAAIVGVAFVATPDLFTEEGAWSPVNTAMSAVMYLVLAFIGVYFHAAVVAAAHERLEGGNPTVGSGLRAANKHLGKLFLWSIMIATVNILLQMLREKGGMIGRIAAGIAGTAWNLATYFVVPNLIFTDKGVGDSLRASGSLFKQRWGETVAGHIGIGFAMGIVTFVWVLLGIALTVGLATFGSAGFIIGAIVTITGVILLAILGSVLSAVYKAALYRYANTNDEGPFTGLAKAAY